METPKEIFEKHWKKHYEGDLPGKQMMKVVSEAMKEFANQPKISGKELIYKI